MIVAALVYSLAFLEFSLAVDTLPANQTLLDGQTLISEGQIFEVGFFSPAKSSYRFLGIWYKATPDVVVCVANRNKPLADRLGVLTISRNGTLVLMRGKSIIWSSTSSTIASEPVVQLLHTGNLVLMDKETETPNKYIWQSFDYPSDTRLPGMEMVTNLGKTEDKYLTSWRSSDDPSVGGFSYRLVYHDGLVELLVYNGKDKRCRSGPWDGQTFSQLGITSINPFKLLLKFNEDRISLSDHSPLVTRLTLDTSGFLQRYIMNERRTGWNLVIPVPRDSCDNYAQCGPNGICRISKIPICECLKGYAPKSQKDWNLEDWSGGCVRIKPPNCQEGDGFLKLGVKFPDTWLFQLNATTSFNDNDCQVQCLKNCSCIAYTTTTIHGGVFGCLMWFGDLIDIRELSGVDSIPNIYIRLPVSELEASNYLGKRKKSSKKLIFILSAVGVLFCGLIYGVIRLKKRLKKEGVERKTEELELPLFDLPTVAAATDNFSIENMIGEGGFGPVYRGGLLDGQGIAVKRLSKTSRQGLEEFKNEVSLIAKLQHRNLVRLLGCCTRGEERMLIYEYMENKSLDKFIFDEDGRRILTWAKRFDIIIGIARGLLYLHHDSRLKIIHRDLKSSNILLDENLNPKISDFGLARIAGAGQSTATTKRVIGTYGYMAPEYAFDGKFSVKSDVFSLGVVLLEIVTGKQNRSFRLMDHYNSLLGHAWLLWKEDKALGLMDECLKDSYVESQVKRCIHVGLLCVQQLAEDRPLMSSVLFMLGNEEGTNLPDPKEPGFFMGLSCCNEEIPTPKHNANTNTLTMSDFEAR